MNRSDRKAIADIRARIARMEGDANELATALNDLSAAEQDKYDNMSEGLQESERGQRIAEIVDELSTIAGHMEQVAEECSEAASEIDGL